MGDAKADKIKKVIVWNQILIIAAWKMQTK
jgi:hypothetical protein